MAYEVIVHQADGECSTEASFEHRDLAILYAEVKAKDLIQGREWVYVCGYTFQGKKEAI